MFWQHAHWLGIIPLIIMPWIGPKIGNLKASLIGLIGAIWLLIVFIVQITR